MKAARKRVINIAWRNNDELVVKKNHVIDFVPGLGASYFFSGVVDFF